MELDAGPTVDQALAAVQRATWAPAPFGLSLVTAINGRKVLGGHELADGDRLVVILGMSGS